MQLRQVPGIEIVAVNEGVVDDDGVGAPSGVPAPPSPSTPTAAEVGADADARAPSEKDADARPRRPKPPRIRIIERRSPEPDRIIHRHVYHRRIGRFNLDGRRTVRAWDRAYGFL